MSAASFVGAINLEATDRSPFYQKSRCNFPQPSAQVRGADSIFPAGNPSITGHLHRATSPVTTEKLAGESGPGPRAGNERCDF